MILIGAIEQPSVGVGATKLVARLDSCSTVVERRGDDAVHACLGVLRHLCGIALGYEGVAQVVGIVNIAEGTTYDVESLEGAAVHDGEAFLTVVGSVGCCWGGDRCVVTTGVTVTGAVSTWSVVLVLCHFLCFGFFVRLLVTAFR